MAKEKVLNLRPTQFAIGMFEVHQKLNEFQKQKHKRRWVDQTQVPIVIDPTGEKFVIDRHHFLFVCWSEEIKKVRVKVVKEFSKKTTFDVFWSTMKRRHWCHLYDQFGKGPRSPIYLPHDVRGLADDPYRSLAWLVRQHGGYENTDQTYAEFQWANFFREHALLDRRFHLDLEVRVKQATQLAKSRHAKNLPGYLGKKRR